MTGLRARGNGIWCGLALVLAALLAGATAAEASQSWPSIKTELYGDRAIHDGSP